MAAANSKSQMIKQYFWFS